MGSTFQGLEIARSALFAQQTALYTTSNNIANANTKGYTRQRVNFEQISPYPAAGLNRPQIAGQQGTGVQAGSIERIRNSYLDAQYRSQTGTAAYWSMKSEALSRMEGVINEPSDSGLSAVLDDFWSSLQDLSATPEESGARSVALEKGKAVAETFNYISGSLTNVRGDLRDQIDNVSVKSINSYMNQINELNKQIAEMEPHGMVTNDLYDKRDVLIDELSSMVNIKVEYQDSGGLAPTAAQGIAKITLVDDQGAAQAVLVDPETKTYQPLSIQYGQDENGMEAVESITFGDTEIAVEDFTSKGELKGLIDSYGYLEDGSVKGTYPEMMKNLDKMAFNFAQAINAVQQTGYTKGGVVSGIDFFDAGGSEYGAAANISLSDEIDGNPDLIAVSADGTSGNGDNAKKLSEAMRSPLDGLGGTSVSSFYEGMIGTLGVNAQEAKRQATNSTSLVDQADLQRQSVSSVSLDEEMTNMIKFQHAYNAAARSMTATDEMLDTIINNMGLVGR
ncbi:flagellar hook-associated protein FlgK [Terribacillus saccharophilus]|uniref:Flagellar hook-associated protein 1 n=1 Tax=Terribacillus saccharophilus TaxID=361277 RepID=A0ABX4H0J0_9BACI|nr:flagellar hook-associated protein FlgK [Terribacillus saccharophilus]PAD35906.1 flagellar hook-associated protein FlgK [Terribacillus saccharophilus]PAD97044.1 flagellar hook-associated protein FlgK [Terribacillus saccharophilus]PAE00620.1 flagellar hook-associated protein FlgK [Terribacillus saccharophilus]